MHSVSIFYMCVGLNVIKIPLLHRKRPASTSWRTPTRTIWTPGGSMVSDPTPTASTNWRTPTQDQTDDLDAYMRR